MVSTAASKGAAGVPECRGPLITLEGCDGCGKTTQAELLCARLCSLGLPVGVAQAPGAVVREPGGTSLGEQLRELVLNGPVGSFWAEALLYAAARAELVEHVLLPELKAGRVLVLDRFIDSSLAYQGHARGLGFRQVLAVNEPGLRGLFPDLTLVLDLDPEVALARRRGEPDRIESEGLAFQRLVAEGFREVARRFPERVRSVDASGSVEEVADLVWAEVSRSFPELAG